MGKTGILGGTFNPIHLGHLKLAERAYKELNLDRVLIMPTGISYLKAGSYIESKEVRSDMVKLAIKDYPYFEFSDIEVNREGNTYTFETLSILSADNPDEEYFYIIGADTLYSIENWKNPDKIFDKCTICVMNRDDSDYGDLAIQAKKLKNSYDAKIVILNSPKIDISSSTIRALFSENKLESVQSMLPKEVYDFIISNNLYH